MKYFFILGNNPTLSIAELGALFDLSRALIMGNALILDIGGEVDAEELIKKIGGTIKIGKIIKICENKQTEIVKNGQEILLAGLTEKTNKIKFGFSSYGLKINLRRTGLEIKEELKNKGYSSRLVTSREKNLSSVIVTQNKLLETGAEIIILPTPESKNQVLIGKTLAVQPFKELSFRDYGRPGRDDYSGMLPPKLAQIMINLALPHPNPPLVRGGSDSVAGAGGVILDPFCGSGTILTEAVLMGYKNLIGADISKKAAKDTKQNIEWIKKRYAIGDMRYEIYITSATQLSQALEPKTIDAIITEPYLGPQRGKIDFKKVALELEKLYSDSLREFRKFLKPDGKIVMVFPIFRALRITSRISPDLNGFRIINPIPESLRNHPTIKPTNRNTIIYGREGQKVWREITVLKIK